MLHKPPQNSCAKQLAPTMQLRPLSEHESMCPIWCMCTLICCGQFLDHHHQSYPQDLLSTSETTLTVTDASTPDTTLQVQPVLVALCQRDCLDASISPAIMEQMLDLSALRNVRTGSIDVASSVANDLPILQQVFNWILQHHAG